MVLPGDFLSPSILSSINYGKSMVDCLNEIGLDYCCFGNHEDDIPFDELKERIKESKFIWLNSNINNLDIDMPDKIKKYVEINDNIVLIGLATHDKKLYCSLFNNASIDNVVDSAKTLNNIFINKTIIPLTHQLIDEDEILEKLNIFPIIIGGHDHEIHETATILKIGKNAENIGIIDLIYNDESQKYIMTKKIVKCTDYEKDTQIIEKINYHNKILDTLKNTPLFNIKSISNIYKPFSSKNIRFQSSTVASYFADVIKEELQVDCVILNAGLIRGEKEYYDDNFYYHDFKKELVIENNIVSITLPRYVIIEAIKDSHNLKFGTGGYLHVNSDFDLNHLSKENITCAVSFNMLLGMDNHTKILNYVKKYNIYIPSEDNHKNIVNIIISYFSKKIIFDIFKDNNIDEIFVNIDINNDGLLSKDELYNELQKHYIYLNKNSIQLIVDNIFTELDINKDKYISIDEIKNTMKINN